MSKKLHILRKIALTCCICLLLALSTVAQYNRPENKTWVFGVENGIHFNSSNPTPITTNINSGWSNVVEGCASISNSNGDLLFYTNGNMIWDKNNNVMPNGTLSYPANESSLSATQGALIVPFPADKNKYYVFTVTNIWAFFILPGNFYYSIVDMTLNNGLGDVVSGQNAIFLEGSVAEKMTSVPGDSCNVWVLRCDFSGVYKAYEITNSTFNTNPVVSISALPNEVGGAIMVSPDRLKIATASFSQLGGNAVGLILSDFNPATGIVSNSRYLDSTNEYYSVCFSPDNTKLYATMYGSGGGLYQFDLSSATPATTKTLLSSATSPYGMGALKLAPDEKIYVLDGINVGVLSSPNALGSTSQYSNSGISVGSNSVFGFPNEVMFPLLYDMISTVKDTLICTGLPDSGIALYANNIDTEYTYLWNTNDTSSDIQISSEGIYWVEYGNYCYRYVDTFNIRVSDLFTTITVNDENELGTIGGPFATYQWFLYEEPIPGATDSIYNITANGDYTVKVTDENGCEYMSSIYTVTNWEDVYIEHLHSSAVVNVYPNPTEDIIYINSPVKVDAVISGIDGRRISLFPQATSVSLKQLVKGIYILQLTDKNGRVLEVKKIIKQ